MSVWIGTVQRVFTKTYFPTLRLTFPGAPLIGSDAAIGFSTKIDTTIGSSFFGDGATPTYRCIAFITSGKSTSTIEGRGFPVTLELSLVHDAGSPGYLIAYGTFVAPAECFARYNVRLLNGEQVGLSLQIPFAPLAEMWTTGSATGVTDRAWLACNTRSTDNLHGPST